MKKIVYVLFLATLLFLFTSCGNTNDNKPVPDVNAQLSLKIGDYGDVLIWNRLDEDYEVYCDNKRVVETSNYYYDLPDNISHDSEYYVISKKTKSKSNTITVKANTLIEDEILDLSTNYTYTSEIGSKIKKIIIGSEEQTSFTLHSIIRSRTDNLIIELNNVNISGYIKYEKEIKNLDFNLIIRNNGNNSIASSNGSIGADYSNEIYYDKEYDAGVGGDANTVIEVPKVTFEGSGTLKLIGGNGGDGGKGSGTTTWTDMYPGKGSNGGNGGAALNVSYLIMNSIKADLTVEYKDGIGGKKGTPGSNNSIVSGPVCSAVWSKFDCGKSGEDGKTTISKKYILRGGINNA